LFTSLHGTVFANEGCQAIEVLSDGVRMAAKHGPITIRGVIGAGLIVALTVAGIQAANGSDSNKNSERMLYNKLFEVIMTLTN
jgi:hypothetical protein